MATKCGTVNFSIIIGRLRAPGHKELHNTHQELIEPKVSLIMNRITSIENIGPLTFTNFLDRRSRLPKGSEPSCYIHTQLSRCLQLRTVADLPDVPKLCLRSLLKLGLDNRGDFL